MIGCRKKNVFARVVWLWNSVVTQSIPLQIGSQEVDRAAAWLPGVCTAPGWVRRHNSYMSTYLLANLPFGMATMCHGLERQNGCGECNPPARPRVVAE